MDKTKQREKMDERKTYKDTMRNLLEASDANFDEIIDVILSGRCANRVEVDGAEQLCLALMLNCSSRSVKEVFLKKSVNLLGYINKKLKDDEIGSQYPDVLRVKSTALEGNDILVEIDFVPTPLAPPSS